MRKPYTAIVLLVVLNTCLSLANSAPPSSPQPVTDLVGQPTSVEVTPTAIELQGRRDTVQLLVTGRYPDGSTRDLTRSATWKQDAPQLVAITSTGLVTARQDGRTRLTIQVGDKSVLVPVHVQDAEVSTPISFRHEVMPVLSLAGCSDIRCHGAPSGKSNFRLSLWGHDPSLDIQQLTRAASGRRTNSLDPANSLIVKKALVQVPHVGGRRLPDDSPFLELLTGWQSQGLHDDLSAQVTSLTITPTNRVLRAPARQQQLRVLAKFENHRVLDVTHLTTFSSTDLATAEVNRSGSVEFNRQGEVAILCRFCGRLESVRLMHIAAPPSDFRWPKPPENNFVDKHVFAKLQLLHIVPSDLSSDEEFVRRVFLDLCGVLPTAKESAEFVSATAANKRTQLIDQLLARPEFADLWTKRWLDVLRVSRDSIQLAGAQAFQKWLRTRIAEDAPFDQLVRDMLTATGASYTTPAVNFYCVPRTPEKVTDPLYLQKDLAEATAQLFLGIRLQCAQCHNHPYERWTQDDYLSLAAFFTQVKRSRLGKAGRKGRPERRQIEIALDTKQPEMKRESSGTVVAPGFPGQDARNIDANEDRRPVLAEWLTNRDNPFFAKAFVNRVWFHLHGRGIVEPVDDFRDSNPSSNDPLLDALANEFVANGYRLKPLIRAIANSRTYQLSSRPNASNRRDRRYFSHMKARPMAAEVLLDAIASFTGVPEQFEVAKDYIEGLPDGTIKFPLGTRAVQLPVNDIATLINTQGKYVRYELHPFLRVFGQPNGTETCECARETSFGRKQALELFVGEMLSGRLARPDNFLAELMSQDASDAERLDVLFRRGLSRSPSPEDSTRFLGHLRDTADKREAWEDILWAIVNSQEFVYQH